MHKYLKTEVSNTGSTYISSWGSKGLSHEKISSIITSSYSLASNLIYRNARFEARFHGSFLSKIKLHALMGQ